MMWPSVNRTTSHVDTCSEQRGTISRRKESDWNQIRQQSEHSLIVPVQVSHHEALEVGGHEAVEGRPGEQPVLGPLWLVVGGHVELRVPQGHADVVQQPGQRPEFEDGVLQQGAGWGEKCRSKSNSGIF